MGMNLESQTFLDITSMTLQDFKDDYYATQANFQLSAAGRYYTALSLEAQNNSLTNVLNYAQLAKGVATNAGLNGKLANVYTYEIAYDQQTAFTVGDDNWLKMQYNLMQKDYILRKDLILMGKSGELDYRQTIDIHTESLGEVGLGANGFSLYTPPDPL